MYVYMYMCVLTYIYIYIYIYSVCISVLYTFKIVLSQHYPRVRRCAWEGGSFVKNSYVSTLCPVVIRPCLCT